MNCLFSEITVGTEYPHSWKWIDQLFGEGTLNSGRTNSFISKSLLKFITSTLSRQTLSEM